VVPFSAHAQIEHAFGEAEAAAQRLISQQASLPWSDKQNMYFSLFLDKWLVEE